MTDNSKAFVLDSDMAWEDLGGGIKRKIMAFNENLMILKVAFEKGGVGSLHHHPHTQASYVESGKFEITINGQMKILKAGDVFFVNPDLVHGAVCIASGILIDIFNPMREDFVY